MSLNYCPSFNEIIFKKSLLNSYFLITVYLIVSFSLLFYITRKKTDKNIIEWGNKNNTNIRINKSFNCNF